MYLLISKWKIQQNRYIALAEYSITRVILVLFIYLCFFGSFRFFNFYGQFEMFTCINSKQDYIKLQGLEYIYCSNVIQSLNLMYMQFVIFWSYESHCERSDSRLNPNMGKRPSIPELCISLFSFALVKHIISRR